MGRRTFIRMHVKSSSGDHGPVGAALHVYRDNNLQGILTPSNPGGTITIRQNPNRMQLHDAFLFELPVDWAWWTVTLIGVIDERWAQGDTSTDSWTGFAAFEDVMPMELILVDTQYTLGNTTYMVSWEMMLEQASWLARIFPVREVHTSYWEMGPYGGSLDIDGNLTAPDCVTVDQDLGWHLTNNSFETAGQTWARAYGMVSDSGGFMRGCALSSPSLVASGPSWLSGEWYGSHELGHAYSQPHTLGSQPAPGGCDGGCGCEGDAIDRGRNGDISLTKGATVVSTLYGLDIETLQIYPPDWKENMTYCNPEWISDYGYESIMDRMQWEDDNWQAARAVQAPGEHVAVFGKIVMATDQVTLDTFYRLPEVQNAPVRTPGPYNIRLLGAGGVTLAHYPFTPYETHVERGPSYSPSAGAIPPALISEYVPWVTGTAAVAILHGEVELARRMVSAHAPTVTLLSPNSGPLPPGPMVTVTWSASDADGDPLVFSLEYSRDGGATWQMLRSRLGGSSTALSLEKLGGTTSGKFRIMASDGINTTRDASDGVFAVADKAPIVLLKSPPDGARYVPGQPVPLIAQAYDVEDKSLAAAALAWSSDRDGALGTGALAHATDLSLGVHTLTLDVSDSHGHHVQQQRRIFIGAGRQSVYLPVIMR
jgi:hypothetical protein